MNFKSYIQRLVPAIERKDVMNVLTTLRDDVLVDTIAITRDVVDALGDHAYKGETSRALQKRLNLNLRGDMSRPLEITQDTLEKMPALLDVMEARVRKLFSFQISTYHMSFERANVLRLLDAMEFYVHVHRRVVLRMLQEEVAGLRNTPVSGSKGFQQFVTDNLNAYADLAGVFYTTPQAFAAKLDRVSNAEISDETFDLARQSLGTLKTDPFLLESRFAPHHLRPINPFFSIGKARAERQVRRYKLMKEEIQALQLRLQELREIQNTGNTNPKLQKLIAFSERQLEELNYRVETFEESLETEESFV